MGKIVAICSGSGGTGKSTVALSVAVGAAKRNKRTILLDASGVSRSCDLMLGLESIVVLDMIDVAKQQASVYSALYTVPGRKNLQFACASLYDGSSIRELSGILLALRAMCDVLVIDLPTGSVTLEEGILAENDSLVLVTRPDDISIRALERVLNTIERTNAQRYLLLNRVNPSWTKNRISYDCRSVEMLLDMPIICSIPEDERVVFGMKKGKTAIECGSKVEAALNTLLNAIL